MIEKKLARTHAMMATTSARQSYDSSDLPVITTMNGRTIFEDKGILDPEATVAAREKEQGSEDATSTNSDSAEPLERLRMFRVGQHSWRRGQGWPERRSRARQRRGRCGSHNGAACG
jgi:hypothetical protein